MFILTLFILIIDGQSCSVNTQRHHGFQMSDVWTSCMSCKLWSGTFMVRVFLQHNLPNLDRIEIWAKWRKVYEIFVFFLKPFLNNDCMYINLQKEDTDSMRYLDTLNETCWSGASLTLSWSHHKLVRSLHSPIFPASNMLTWRTDCLHPA